MRRPKRPRQPLDHHSLSRAPRLKTSTKIFGTIAIAVACLYGVFNSNNSGRKIPDGETVFSTDFSVGEGPKQREIPFEIVIVDGRVQVDIQGERLDVEFAEVKVSQNIVTVMDYLNLDNVVVDDECNTVGIAPTPSEGSGELSLEMNGDEIIATYKHSEFLSLTARICKKELGRIIAERQKRNAGAEPGFVDKVTFDLKSACIDGPLDYHLENPQCTVTLKKPDVEEENEVIASKDE